jgi:ribosome-binding factor A
MATRRIQRLNAQLRQDLAELISRELKDPRLAGLISVMSVDLSPDLHNAKVYISVLGTEADRKHSLTALKSASGFLRSQIAARLTTKRAPELYFQLDSSLERGERIITLIREVEQETAARVAELEAVSESSDERA